MRPRYVSLLTLLFISARPVPASAADVVARVIDGLGRPVAQAVVDIYWLKAESNGDVRHVSVLKMVSDGHGVVKGTYDEKGIPSDEFVSIEVSKEGYSGYSTTDFKPEYVLKREFGPADVRRIAALDEKAQVNELRELLAGDVDEFLEHSGGGLSELIFVQEHRFRPALQALIQDAKVGTAAGELLAFIGVPEDVRLVIDHAPPPKRESFENRWAYGVVTSLLEPATEKEWSFLRSCALNEYNDRWVIAGAINVLKLIASPRSVQILREVGKVNRYLAEYTESAIQDVKSSPPVLSGEDLVAAGEKVAQAVRIGNWKGNKTPRFNERGDKALVDCQFIAGRDLLIYTATFHKVDGKWKLRGIRETMQALLAQEPVQGEGGSSDGGAGRVNVP